MDEPQIDNQIPTQSQEVPQAPAQEQVATSPLPESISPGVVVSGGGLLSGKVIGLIVLVVVVVGGIIYATFFRGGTNPSLQNPNGLSFKLDQPDHVTVSQNGSSTSPDLTCNDILTTAKLKDISGGDFPVINVISGVLTECDYSQRRGDRLRVFVTTIPLGANADSLWKGTSDTAKLYSGKTFENVSGVGSDAFFALRGDKETELHFLSSNKRYTAHLDIEPLDGYPDSVHLLMSDSKNMAIKIGQAVNANLSR